MDERFARLAAAAADNHGVFTTTTARSFGVSDRLRHEWLERGWIQRLGTHTFRFVGTPDTWQMNLAATLGDLGREAAIAGRSAATLNRLDGFTTGRVEVWVPRSSRNRARNELTRTSSLPMFPGDLVTIDGIRCVTAERLILDSMLFRFTEDETHNAIDSALRLRLVSEKRLRDRIVRDLAPNVRNRGTLIDALVDTGGESVLERRFLAIVRKGGLPRPDMRRVYRSGTRTLARVDAEFGGGLIIEVAGHATHASRMQRQRDEQRKTELTLRGKRVITFTYDDVYGRPNWVLGILREAGIGAAA